MKSKRKAGFAKKRILLVVSVFLVIAVALGVYAVITNNNMDDRSQAGNDIKDIKLTTDGSANFQLSTLVDLNLTKSTKGYFTSYKTGATETLATEQEIQNAKKTLRTSYHVNEIYLLYHRSIDISSAKNLFLKWKNAPVFDSSALYIIPTLDLWNSVDGCMYTNQEISDLVTYLKQNINASAIAINGASTRPEENNFCGQLQLIKNIMGDGKIHRMGIQPSTPLNALFERGIADTWSAVSAGNTNTKWNGECSGKTTLKNWVSTRIGQNKKMAWNFITVALNYSQTNGCGTGGTPYDKLPQGRTLLAHDAIVSTYPNGGANPVWAGFSTDLVILNWYSEEKDSADKRFYNRIKNGQIYNGYYSTALNEISQIFDIYDGLEVQTPKTCAITPTFNKQSNVTTVTPGGSISITCSKMQANLDCITVQQSSDGLHNCKYKTGDSSSATFTCTAPTQPGLYSFKCGAFSNSTSNCCSGYNDGITGRYEVR